MVDIIIYNDDLIYATPLRRWIPDNVSVTLCTVPPVGQTQVCPARSCATGDAIDNWLLVRYLFGELYGCAGAVQAHPDSGACPLTSRLLHA